uniref:Secreted protein n=1 Tax=Echinococcus granulosus TaxID=6210 RepID=A0A068WPR3_ECHGR|nr:hypothetical protein EgrG_001115200 [Echinococcus granulosus]
MRHSTDLLLSSLHTFLFYYLFSLSYDALFVNDVQMQSSSLGSRSPALPPPLSTRLTPYVTLPVSLSPCLCSCPCVSHREKQEHRKLIK